MKSFFAILAVIICCAGCVNIEYSGSVAEALPENAPAPVVFYDAAKITRSYSVIGSAVASGNYRDVGNDRILDALKEKARECGANAILITSIRVEADRINTAGASSFTTQWDLTSAESNWQTIYRDVDQGFVNNMRNGGAHTTSGSSNNFTRIIEAEFLRY